MKMATMVSLGVVCAALVLAGAEVETMTKMNVRLTGPGIRSGSTAAMPKLIYRAGAKYARLENAPDAHSRIQKITIIAEPDAYSIDLMGRTGTHAIEQGGENDLHLPMVLPLDPRHKQGILDRLEFGAELEFFQKTGAQKIEGPLVNMKPTNRYVLKLPTGPAELTTRGDSDIPVFLTWTATEGRYRYEYITYEDVPFDAKLFAKPEGIRFREMKPLSEDELNHQ